MSGVKHTPGPLAIFPERDRQWLWVMDELGTKRVARVVLYDGMEDEMEANARLIAAAPDLLEAGAELQAARKAHKLAPSAENLSRVRIASDAFDAALARARGEQDGVGNDY